MASGGVRERNVPNKQTNGDAGGKTKAKVPAGKKEGAFSVMDALRILGGLFLLNCLLSYFITNDSVLWGWRPWFVRPGVVMRYIVSIPLRFVAHCSSLMVHTARTRPPDRQRARRIRWQRSHQTHLPRAEWNHLRRLRRPACVRSRW